MLRIDAVDGTVEDGTARTRVRAYMDVGELHNLIAIESGRQIVEGVVKMFHLQPAEAYRTAINQHKQRIESQHETDEVAPVDAFLAPTADAPSQKRADGIECLGNNKKSQEEQIPIEQRDIVGGKVPRERHSNRKHQHHQSRSPPQQPFPPRILDAVAEVMHVDIQIGQYDGEDEK